jgi:hypothetical protein
MAAALLGNRLLDSSPPMENASALIAVERSGKGGQVFVLRSWREGRAAERIHRALLVESALHAGIPAGTPLVVTTRAGALGWEWVERIAVAGGAQPSTTKQP